MNLEDFPLETLAAMALDELFPARFRSEVIVELTKRSADEAYRRGYSDGLEEGRSS